MKKLGKLNALEVSRPKAPGLYGDGGNLWLQVTDKGTKSWVFRYTFKGRQRMMGLGSINDRSLAEARAVAGDKRLLLLRGKDPIEEDRAEKALALAAAASNVTFEECARAYIAAHSPGWKSTQHLDQWNESLSNHVYPVIGALPVGSIDTTLVLKVLEPIWTKIPPSAQRIRGRIEQVLNFAKSRGQRVGENPARYQGHLDNLLAKMSRTRKVRHQPALPHAEIGDFMVKLRERDCVSRLALEFTILTAARSMETIRCKWSEVNLEAKVWLLPAARMKSSREHRVPLSDRAVEILRKMLPRRRENEGDYIFPGAGRRTKSLSDHAMLMLLKGMGYGHVVTHGFRSTFRDWAAEMTAYPREVVELALAHSIGSDTEASYFRSDLFQKRAKLMQAWQDYCNTPSAARANNVVAMNAAG